MPELVNDRPAPRALGDAAVASVAMFSDQDAGRYLFHYTRAETFLLHILPTMQLRMSPFANLNDPRESRTWLCTIRLSDGASRDWDLLTISREFSEFMKGTASVLCFTRDDPDFSPGRHAHLYGRGYAHPSMWDRYAGNHSGVCLALDIDHLSDDIARSVGEKGDLLYMDVSYEDMDERDLRAFELEASDLESKGLESTFREHQERYHGRLYFSKGKDWSNEFEWRWVLLASKPGPYFVDVSGSLSGVIFGDAFPVGAIDMVQGLVASRGLQLASIRYRNGDPVVLPL
jgi:Protein of unknown function (DUF2971)